MGARCLIKSSDDREETAPQQFYLGTSMSSMFNALATERAEISKFLALVFKVQPG